MPMSEWNRRVIEEFRANGGRVGGPFEGRPLLLLHHTGARSGVRRVTPLMYQTVPGGTAIFASAGGSDTNPGWYHNLLAHPETDIEVGEETAPVTARLAEGEEYAQIWSRQKADYPFFADYERQTRRDRIPVFVLEPR
jgi:deazaflavin-dependent oxidoreductase (nitroreductase family)